MAAQKAITRLFLNNRFVFTIILLNALILFIQEMGVNTLWLNTLDVLCTLLFTVEMIIKHKVWGAKRYWSNGWNRMDGILVILSLPSIFAYIWPDAVFNVHFLLALRLLRIFRFFRVFHLFPNFTNILDHLKLAFRQGFSIFVGFGILLFVFALISCAIFHTASPTYFGNPLESLYSIFKLCTIEGWYDIPEAVSSGSPSWSIHLVRLYFVSILVGMGL
ncbi:MAG: ion transporter, partial [Paludibacteraceae bacterium]|nr:ion transporter [Paludibacteraceae bacterium]